MLEKEMMVRVGKPFEFRQLGTGMFSVSSSNTFYKANYAQIEEKCVEVADENKMFYSVPGTPEGYNEYHIPVY